jgi:nitroimidazol reductase NimA-like FMN-containing flavoprotein (pyridoxamine 5'-phosphate oxidase superfamily)
MKIEMMRKNPDVCVEVDHMENMANWRSVIAWGTFRELEGEEAMSSMHRLIDRLTPLLSSVMSQPTHGLEATHGADTAGRSVVIYRIDFQRKTGRFERR